MIEKILAKGEIYCDLHKKQKIKYMCQNIKCVNNPFLCKLCLSQFKIKKQHHSHYQNLSPVQIAIKSISKIIKNHKFVLLQIYKSIQNQKDYKSLLKWQYEKQKHYIAIENHIKTQKHRLRQQMNMIIEQLQKTSENLIKNVQVMFDNFYKNYKQSFEIFKSYTQPLSNFNKYIKYYSNQNNIVFKFISQPLNQTQEWMLNLKSSLTFSEKIIQNCKQYNVKVVKTINHINLFLDQLPCVIGFNMKGSNYILTELFQQQFKKSLKINEISSLVDVFKEQNKIKVEDIQNKKDIMTSKRKQIFLQ